MLYVPFFLDLAYFSLLIFLSYSTLSIALTSYSHANALFSPLTLSISFDMMIRLFRVDLAFLRCIPQFVIDVIPLYHHSGVYYISTQVHLAQSLATLGQSMKYPPRTNVVGPLTYAIIIFFIVYELGVLFTHTKVATTGCSSWSKQSSRTPPTSAFSPQ